MRCLRLVQLEQQARVCHGPTVVSLAATFGRGAMTNHWRDIRHAELILMNGANPAEAHPVGFQWFMRAKLDRGAKISHADPRFTRTSAVADTYLRIRTGSDVAYFGGLINHVLQNNLFHDAYVRNYTNASFIVKQGYAFNDGLFSGYNPDGRTYNIATWSYESDSATGFARRDMTLQDPQSVFQLMKTHYSRYTPEVVSSITGIPVADFNKVADLVGQMGKPDNEFAFNFVPKPAQNSSWMSIYDQALKGKMEGLMLSGMTAASIGPDSNQVQSALGKLKWLVIMDALPTTSSEFWRAPGADPSQIKTEVFMLPATHWIEKDGSFVNSGRWSQWKDQVLPPQGQARHDHWILAELFQRVKKLYQSQGGKFPDPILMLTFDYKDPLKPELDEIAREINGKDLATGKQMTTFANLKDDGTTTTGDWIYTGSYPDSGNLMKRRGGIQDPKTNDPTGMGFYPNWSWSWPLNRRVMYNRASADLDGKAWDPSRPGITWDGSKWVGDVPDYPATMNPHAPNAYLPFIMNGAGIGRLFSNGMVDGPFPEHYEPVESPVANPLHPNNSASPVAFLYDKAAGRPNRFGTPQEFPYIATSYRLTEHEHYVTQHVPHLVQLQPKPFVEIPYELAGQKGIKSGDRVRVSSKRGKVEVLALVTKRLGPMTVAGQKVYQIGIPIHWGYVGISADSDPSRGRYWLANALTPFVGDANARTPEFKAFLVNLEKM